MSLLMLEKIKLTKKEKILYLIQEVSLFKIAYFLLQMKNYNKMRC